MRSFLRRTPLPALALLGLPLGTFACSSSATGPDGQSDFVSAPLGGTTSVGASDNAAAGTAGGGGALAAGAPAAKAPPTSPTPPTAKTPGRTVQETDLYRYDAATNRLYYLNSYRGLMVFDVTDVDHPKFIGRSAIYGSPVDMIVQGTTAIVVVGDWYGTLDTGEPFHGSIVRGLDASDPANIKVIGDAKLGGWVQEDRVVGNVLYAVSQDEGWSYSWGGGGPVAISNGGGVGVAVVGSSTTGGGANVIVSSVSFANNQIKQVASKTYAGYGGVFNVTPNAILLAHPDVPPQTTGGVYVPVTQTDLQYLDITDPGGAIAERGTLKVDGTIDTYGADNGRWNLDFADGVTAHVIGTAPSSGTAAGNAYVLSIADFSNPDAPVLDGSLTIQSPGWSAVARFDTGRMYLSPDSSYFNGTSTPASTPLQVFDLSNPKAPTYAGSAALPGNVWLMIPAGAPGSTSTQPVPATRLFALGASQSQTASQIALSYVDVSNPAAPAVLGTPTFGEGWASTPASDTFKAFDMDTQDSPNMVVLPFSGWDSTSQAYNDGVQLIEFSPSSITLAGAAHTKGWVQRGIVVKNRIVSLSDLALAVVDHTDPMNPQVVTELTLARSVISAQPGGSTIAEVSSDFWDNDVSHSDVRVLPVTDSEENADESSAVDAQVDGVDAQVFTNGTLDYIVTSIQVPVPCGQAGGPGVAQPAGGGISPSVTPTKCTASQQQVQVVDLSGGGARLRGKVMLPLDPGGYYGGWDWGGFYYYDWFDGAPVVQVQNSALAFRRWTQQYSPSGTWVDASSDLYVVDLSNPDAPSIASTVITHDPTGWWGDMKVVGDTLYTSHYEWVTPPTVKSASGNVVSNSQPTGRYYLDRIDLGDRKHPKIESKVNVPGALVGGSATDPSLLYTIDSSWDGNTSRNWFDVVRIDGNRAHLKSSIQLDGWTGQVIVRGSTAYLTTQVYSDKRQANQPGMELHQIDVTNPAHPVDHVASGKNGWGWLLDVQGDRALVTSGWGSDGLDIYKLSPTAAPVYDQFVRTRGWSVRSLSRQDNTIFLSSGYWGVQAVTLQ
jgi:hypothetical protein